MKILHLSVITLLLWPGRALCADSPDPLPEALPALQKDFPAFAELNFKPGDKLGDLVTRSKGKITVGSQVTAPPISTAMLPGSILYWRLASFTPEKSWLETGAQMQQQAATVEGVILDLRSNLAPDDYHGAAQVLSLFPIGQGDPTLINYRADASGNLGVALEQRYSFHVPIVVLVNSTTTGAAEALATCFQADGAVVVGQPTAGAMGVFQSLKLSNGQTLRYYMRPVWNQDPSATFKFPARHDVPWGQPVIPDVAVTTDQHSEKAALILIRDNHIADVIGESPERRRMSEAALLKNQDPEYDDYLASLQDHPVLLSLPVVHDTALITALDSLKAIRVSQLTTSSPKTTTDAPAGGASVQ